MPDHTPYLLAQTTWKTVKDIAYEVAVLPWGATEAHNFHLPYSTDVVQCDYVASEAARRAWDAGARVVVLPTVPFGVNTGQLDVKLDINMHPSTQAAVLRDVVDALARQGIAKIVVLNGHGGNSFRPMIREIGVDYPEVFLCTIDWYRVGDQQAIFDEPGDHAGEMETSAMLHITPDWVLPLDEAGSGAEHPFRLRGLREGWAWAERDWQRATDDTGVGNPATATAEKGRRYLEVVTGHISAFLVELAACDIDDLYER